MKNRITPVICKKVEVIDLENFICISDSDDETDLKPASRHMHSDDVITIDDDDHNDIPPSMDLHNFSSRNESTPVLIVGNVSKSSQYDPMSQKNIDKPVVKQTQPATSMTSTSNSKLVKTFNTRTSPPRKTTINGKRNNTTPISSPQKKPLIKQVTSQDPMLLVPKKWSDPSLQEARAEQRASDFLLSETIAASQARKLSLPRSALLKNSTLGKCQSTIKARSPLKNTSLKRLIESPERPGLMRSMSFEKPSPLMFDTTIRELPENPKRRDSFKWPTQAELSAEMLGSLDRPGRDESPELERTFQRTSKQTNGIVFGSPVRELSGQRVSMQTRDPIYGSPDRETPIQCTSRQTNTTIYRSPERSTHFLSSPIVEYPSNLRKLKTSSSPFSKPSFQKPRVIHELYDEDGKEEDLELFVSIMTSTRRKLQKNVNFMYICFVFNFS